jgi:spore germination cell wall hydrolase CwlJ-like protein
VFGRLKLLLLAPALAGSLGGCAIFSPFAFMSPKECLTRVMYFESLRSSPEGMLAVGTVVMNRARNAKFPHTVCAVVSQPNQFAPGLGWKAMTNRKAKEQAEQVAQAVLNGARHPALGPDAMYFHTAGLHFPYNNMYYVLEAGGNAFYEKRAPGTF